MPNRCPHCGKEFEPKPYYVPLTEKALTLAFLTFVLWNFASHFDETEIWAIVCFATGGGVYIGLKSVAPRAVRFVKRGLAH